jgi:hypothetical protein
MISPRLRNLARHSQQDIRNKQHDHPEKGSGDDLTTRQIELKDAAQVMR